MYRRNQQNYSRNFEMKPIINNNPPIDNFKKDFYVDENAISIEEAEELRSKWEMQLKGENIPLPVSKFEQVTSNKEVLESFKRKGFGEPTPIQSQGWPLALKGKDMVGIAATGSGKTLSYLLPALIHAKDQVSLREGDGPIVLILAPTRELALQIDEVAYEYGRMFDMSSLAVYGGVSYNEQYKKLRRGVEILVATPGRLFDLCDRNFCDLSRVTFMVIDEADRMLDMGFKPQLDKIVPRTNKNRQTLMWSATWPKEVRNLANSYMGTNDYCQIFIGSTELTVKANVKQIVEVVSVHDKIKKLQLVLSSQQDEIGGRVIIFCNQKSRCNNMEYMLQDKGIKAAAIHGDKTQSARTAIINNFKDGRVPILIATDVAARGLDIEDVKMVINYDLPVNVEDYVHRVGRTARGNVKEGMSFSFFSPEEDGGNARKYIELFEKGKVDIPREVYDIADRSAPRRQTRYSSFSRGNNSFNNSYRRNNSFNNSYRRNNYSNDNFNRRSDNYYGSSKRY